VFLRHYLSGFRPPVDESVLNEVSPPADDALFWPAFLLTVGGSSRAAAAFDVDPVDVGLHAADLHRSESWPFLTVPLSGGHRLHVLFRNFEGDAGWDYLLQPAGADDVIALAALEGGFRGPGLAWPELLAVAAQPDTAWTRAQRLLLLLPAVGDADITHDSGAAAEVANAFTAVGGRREHQRDVAAELLAASGRFWGSPAWAWHRGRYVCLGPHSPRKLEAPADHHALIAEALGSRESPTK
jgi:hypothetical protein